MSERTDLPLGNEPGHSLGFQGNPPKVTHRKKPNMNRMRHAAESLAGATSPFMDLIPALTGYIVAKRVCMDQEDELSADDKLAVNQFFEVMLEIIDKEFQAAYDGLGLKTADVLKEVYTAEDASRAYDG
jgi:hypothetical protein